MDDMPFVLLCLQILSCTDDSLKDMKEKQSMIDVVYHKLCNKPNSGYNLLWPQNMFIDSIVDKDTLKKVTPVIFFMETRTYKK